MKTARLARGLAAVVVACACLVPSAWAQETETVRGRCTFIGNPSVEVLGGEVVCDRLLVVGGDVVLQADAAATGDLWVVGGSADVEGGVDGRVLVVGGDLTVADGGRVGGDAFATGTVTVEGSVKDGLTALGDVRLGERADVARVATLGTVAQARGATVRDVSGSGQGGGMLVSLVLALVFCALSALFAWLLVTVAPGPVGRVLGAAQRAPLLALVVGALAWGLALVLFVPLLFTVVGPVLLAAALLGGSLLGWVGLSLGLGARLRPGRAAGPSAAVGGVLLALVTMVLVGGGSLLGAVGGGGLQGPVMCLGLIVLALLWTWGLGASLLTLFGARPWPRAAAPASRVAASEPEPAAPPAPAAGAVVPGAAAMVDPVAPPPAAEVPPGAPEPAAVGVALALGGDSPELADDAGAGEAVSAAAVTGAGAVRAQVETDSAAVPTGSTWDPDAARADVRAVPGISPIYAFLLHEAGLGSVGQLATATVAELRAAVAVPGVAAVSDETLGQWQAAARRMATGD